MSALWPRRVRDFTQPIWMIRANTWASGRNSRVEAPSVVEELVELVDGHAELEHEVAVGEHAALGPPGRAGGVDEGGQVVGVAARTALLELVVGDVGAEAGEDVDGVVGDRPDVVELLEAAAHLGDPRQVLGSLGDDGPGAGVAQDPVDLLGRRGLVDGHGHRAGEPDRVVEERPLVAGLADQGDPVAGLDARRRSGPWRRRVTSARNVGGRDVAPSPPSVRRLNDDRVGGLAGVGDHVVGQVARRGNSIVKGVENSRTVPPPGRVGTRRQATAGSRSGRSGSLHRTVHRVSTGQPIPRCRTATAEGSTWPNRPPPRSSSTPHRPTVMAVIADFPAYPEWAKGVTTADVVSTLRRRRRRAEQVFFALDVSPDQGRVHPRLRLGRRARGHLDPGRGQDAARRSTAPTCCATSATAAPR